jgi:hypothetical protein
MIRKMFQMFTGLVGFIHNRFNVSRLLVFVKNFYNRWPIPFFNKYSCIRPFHRNRLVSIKQLAMKSKNIQQEILVFTQTSFVQKALIENIGNNKKSYPAEEFEKAFLNGMLNEMLPELMLPKQGRKSEISLWQISTGESSLLIDMVEAPDTVQDSHSINPYLFLSAPKMN